MKYSERKVSFTILKFFFGFFLASLSTSSANADILPDFLTDIVEGLEVYKSYHEDADVIRLENLMYWSGLIEEYYEINGVYPLSEVLEAGKPAAIVRIATQGQRQFYYQDSPNYIGKLDYNQQHTFQNIHVISLIRFLERDLEREILEKYDIQKVPVIAPVWLHYFVFSDGYLLWTPCETCKASEITFPVNADPTYQSINVGSPSLANTDDRFFLRSELLGNPVFLDIITRPLHKEIYVRNLVEENHQHWRTIFAESAVSARDTD